MQKRGQGAIEFLLTYAWAILAVVIIVGVGSYLLFFNTGILFPERCFIEPGFECQDFILNSFTGTASFDIQNNKGQDIVISGATLIGKDVNCQIDSDYYPFAVEQDDGTKGLLLENGKDMTIVIPCTKLTGMGKVKSQLEISWSETEQGFGHIAKGDMISNVEENVWPTKDICDKAMMLDEYNNNICDELQGIYGPEGDFPGFACVCNDKYDLCEYDCIIPQTAEAGTLHNEVSCASFDMTPDYIGAEKMKSFARAIASDYLTNTYSEGLFSSGDVVQVYNAVIGISSNILSENNCKRLDITKRNILETHLLDSEFSVMVIGKSAGAGVASDFCYDSDGETFISKGGLYGVHSGVPFTPRDYEDYCTTTGGNELTEFVCDPMKPATITHTCVSGQTCSDGACITVQP